MKNLALPDTLKKKSLKGLRFNLIQMAGQVVCHARKIYIKLGESKGTTDLFNAIREQILALERGPPKCAVT